MDIKKNLPVLLLALLLLAGCSGQKDAQLTGTAEFLLTAEAALTEVAKPTAKPTETLQPTWTASPTSTPWVEVSPSAMATTAVPIFGQPTSTGSSSCNDATFITDVTIPDDTEFDPGESFTKTWRLRNDGSCAWSTDYSIAFVSGSAMDGKTTKLPEIVPVNQTIDVSIKMKAPLEAGTYTGNWTIKDDQGISFGDLFFVTIVVTSSATETPTPAPPTSTPAASPSATVPPSTSTPENTPTATLEPATETTSPSE